MASTESLSDFAERVDARIEEWSDAKYQQHFRAWAEWNGAKEDLFWSGQFGEPESEREPLRERVRAAGERLLTL